MLNLRFRLFLKDLRYYTIRFGFRGALVVAGFFTGWLLMGRMLFLLAGLLLLGHFMSGSVSVTLVEFDHAIDGH